MMRGTKSFKKGFTAFILLAMICAFTIPAYSAVGAPIAQTPIEEIKKSPFNSIIIQMDNPKIVIDGVEKFLHSNKTTTLKIIEGITYFPIQEPDQLFGTLLDQNDIKKYSKLVNGQKFLPLRASFEAANCVVGWDVETKCIIITSGKMADVTAAVAWKSILSQGNWWYGSDEAIRIANNILYNQRNSGGWEKNIDMSGLLTQKDIETLLKNKSKNDATIDNDSTIVQLKYLAKVYNATKIQRYKDSFYKAVDALLLVQYDNGGWPQYLTAQSGYRAQVTFNDNAIVNMINLFDAISKKADPYAFVSDDYVVRATKATEKAVNCILKTQLVVQGVKTAWCQQYDPITLEAATARSYELPSNSGSESVNLVRYLMTIENPSAEVIDAIRSAVAWFEKVKITGVKVIEKADPSLTGGKDKIVVEDPSAPAIWARFYDLETNKPFFVGRDGVKKEHFADIEHERRMGYSYYGNWAAKLIQTEYPAWEAKLLK